VRDAATVFDENAVLLHAPDALWQALRERRWAELFGPLRPLWAGTRVLVFGHAALEKLVAPYKSITGHVWRVAPAFDPAGDLQALDEWLAADLTADRLAAKPLRRCRCWVCRAGGRATRTPVFTTTRRYFGWRGLASLARIRRRPGDQSRCRRPARPAPARAATA
jgi:hypothetical protein